MFKRMIMAIVLTPILVLGLAIPALSSVHGTGAAKSHGVYVAVKPFSIHHKRCDETFTYHLYSQAGSVNGAGTKWVHNTCIMQQRVHEECLNSRMQTPKENGGWVYSTSIWSNKICTGSGGPWVLVWADMEFRNGPGAPLHYVRFYP